jgi:hypothetical protein
MDFNNDNGSLSFLLNNNVIGGNLKNTNLIGATYTLENILISMSLDITKQYYIKINNTISSDEIDTFDDLGNRIYYQENGNVVFIYNESIKLYQVVSTNKINVQVVQIN